MIDSFNDGPTESIWQGRFTKKLPNQIQAVARRKLRMVNAAQRLDDLRIPRPTDLRHCAKTGLASGAFVSTSSAESASPGTTARLIVWKFSTISEWRFI